MEVFAGEYFSFHKHDGPTYIIEDAKSDPVWVGSDLKKALDRWVFFHQLDVLDGGLENVLKSCVDDIEAYREKRDKIMEQAENPVNLLMPKKDILLN